MTSLSWELSDEPLRTLTLALQQLEHCMSEFQLRASNEVDTLFSCIHNIKASIGSIPLGLVLDDCNIIWEMFVILRGMLTEPDVITGLEARLSRLGLIPDQTQRQLTTLTDSTNDIAELVQLLQTFYRWCT
jgi:hypothetical protein